MEHYIVKEAQQSLGDRLALVDKEKMLDTTYLVPTSYPGSLPRSILRTKSRIGTLCIEALRYWMHREQNWDTAYRDTEASYAWTKSRIATLLCVHSLIVRTESRCGTLRMAAKRHSVDREGRCGTTADGDSTGNKGRILFASCQQNDVGGRRADA